MTQTARRLLKERRDALTGRTLNEDQEREYREVCHALERLDAGTWGRCEQCDGAIGRDRLRAIPETRTCVDCTR